MENDTFKTEFIDGLCRILCTSQKKNPQIIVTLASLLIYTAIPWIMGDLITAGTLGGIIKKYKKIFHALVIQWNAYTAICMSLCQYLHSGCKWSNELISNIKSYNNIITHIFKYVSRFDILSKETIQRKIHTARALLIFIVSCPSRLPYWTGASLESMCRWINEMDQPQIIWYINISDTRHGRRLYGMYYICSPITLPH